MSLNMMPPAGYPVNPMWMGTWHGPPPSTMGMYPCPMPMGHMHHDMQSRSQSRAPSPTHSVKSRKSTMSKKSRRTSKYVESEDSDEEKDDRRSMRSERKSLGRYTVRQRPLRDTASMPREVLRRNTLDRLERASIARSRHSVRASSSESDESPSESQKESEAMPEEEEDSPAKERPSGVPQATWECEHCTFVNEAGTRVCSICCKTPTTATVKIIREADNKAVIPPATKIRAAEKRQLLQKGRSSDDYSKDYSETESVQNKLMKLKISSDSYEDSKKSPKIDVRKKGRTIRKISFWPGTKLQK